jgi:hypothetical protein
MYAVINDSVNGEKNPSLNSKSGKTVWEIIFSGRRTLDIGHCASIFRLIKVRRKMS